jgi:3-phenylpropionate/trans-cinnamate dioxygenase ferredoxin component
VSELRVRRDDIKPGTALRLDGGPGGVCLVRIEDDFYAIGDRCSHANVSLSEGDVDAEERWIECWKHGSAFSLEDGHPQSLPAIAPVPVYAVRIDGDEVVVSLDDVTGES